MSSHASNSSERSLPVLLVLFVGSGCAALIYEVVWFELLRQVIGASSVSLAIVLTSYMGGLFLGSWGFPRWISRVHHPLKIYAVLEFGIGV
ncbi:MAG: SAM-dependent methyltransferase, partial [Gammaproteobacteria bacterium]|nr:SAM-dependent methyltransferase [Gammaproteobacteria bacterium]